MKSRSTIYVVDDDDSVRGAIARLVTSAGFTVETFASGQEFLDHGFSEGPCCLIFDVRMPEMDGLELQEAVAAVRPGTPIIFVTGYGTIPLGVRAIKAGAVDFLTKPFDETELLDLIHHALQHDDTALERRKLHMQASGRAATLTPREHEVLALLVSGKRNKQIANTLGIHEKTVQVHRGQVMRKMNADTIVDLVRQVDRL